MKAKPTQEEIESAIKWHECHTKVYQGYEIGGYRNYTRPEALAAVQKRIDNNIPLIGFNPAPQEKWTY